MSALPCPPADSRTPCFRRYFLYEWLSNPDAHRKYLRHSYADALARARQVRPEIFSSHAPRILLCGVGTANTAETFCRFAWQLMPSAQIILFDLRPEVLEKSRRRLQAAGVGRAGQIEIRAGNALAFPFEERTFDWVETDNFLQFFTGRELRSLVAGWGEILKPGGLLSTRQIFPGAGLGGKFSRCAWKTCSRLVSAPCHEHGVGEVQEILLNEKFQIAGIWKARKSLDQITALAAFRAA